MKNKTCKKCGETKPLDYFHKGKRMKDGYRNECKECNKAYQKKWREENAEHHREYVSEYCKRRYQENRAEKLDYQKKRYQENRAEKLEYQKRYYEENRLEILEQSKKYYQQNKERHRELTRKWKQNNPERHKIIWRNGNARRRARKKTNGSYKVTNKDLAKLYNQPCVFCGELGDIQIDHVIPIARGGVHGIGNLQALCEPCNRSKKDKYMIEFKQQKQHR